MGRWTAKFLLLVLLAGLFAPLAAAASMPAQHCVRKPMAAQAQSMPGCHHHAAPAAAPVSVKLAFLSRQCCNEHECCRSTVRRHWVHVNRPTLLGQIDSVHDQVITLRASLDDLELPAYHFVRGPPTP